MTNAINDLRKEVSRFIEAVKNLRMKYPQSLFAKCTIDFETNRDTYDWDPYHKDHEETFRCDYDELRKAAIRSAINNPRASEKIETLDSVFIEYFNLSYGGSFDSPGFRKVGAALRKVLRELEPFCEGNESNAGQSEPEDDGAAHSSDFASINWYGTTYLFTTLQAACIKVLWDAWENRTPVMGEAAIIDAADTDTPLRTIFRNHAAWGTLIDSPSKGRFRLKEPSGKI